MATLIMRRKDEPLVADNDNGIAIAGGSLKLVETSNRFTLALLHTLQAQWRFAPQETKKQAE